MPFQVGDVNKDGFKNAIDFAILEKDVRLNLHKVGVDVGDLDGNGSVGPEDVRLLARRTILGNADYDPQNTRYTRKDFNYLADILYANRNEKDIPGAVAAALGAIKTLASDIDGDGIITPTDLVLLAEEGGFLGDVDGNGIINAADKTALLNFKNNPTLKNAKADSFASFYRADMNHDGEITDEDTALLDEKINGQKSDLNGDGVEDRRDLLILDLYLREEYDELRKMGIDINSQAFLNAVDINGDNIINRDDYDALKARITILGGDIDGNGKIEAKDAGALWAHFFEGKELSEDALLAADIASTDGSLVPDGQVTIHDLQALEAKLKIKKGDLNRDGKLTLSDYELYKQVIESNGKYHFTEVGKMILDANYDGQINEDDWKILGFLPGDVDQSSATEKGVLNINDYVKLYKHIFTNNKITDKILLKLADLTGDGLVDTRDLRRFLEKVNNIKLGDITGPNGTPDGIVDHWDADLLRDSLVPGGPVLTEKQKIMADVNFDGAADIKDSVIINAQVNKTGDFDGNGTVDINDAIGIFNKLKDGIAFTPEEIARVDTQGENGEAKDGIINATDLNRIKGYIGIVPGNVTGDGMVGYDDLRLINDHIRHVKNLSDAGLVISDLNNDFKVDSLDLYAAIASSGIQFGDFDKNGSRDNNDLIRYYQHFAGTKKFSAEEMKLADANLDGVVDGADVWVVKQMIDPTLAKYIPGDINKNPDGSIGDGTLNVNDLKALRDIVIYGRKPTPRQIINADLDFNGVLDKNDLKMLAQLIPYLLKGDVNNDGLINGDDVALVRRALNGEITLNANQLRVADYDGNGQLTALDLEKIQRNTDRALGDINGDGRRNILDLILLYNLTKDSSGASEAEFNAADINGDGVVDIRDLYKFMGLS